ncbi:MAG: isochorismatase family protein [Chlamydiota bacterium]|nr:isochorismatase family protein [Chlamydiota bacterium]
MMKNIILKKPTTGLIVIDIQDRLYGHVERSCEMFHAVKKVVQGFKILNLPILVTEQSPEKMGQTLLSLREELPESDHQYFSKTTFSCMGSEDFKKSVESSPQTQWVLVGMEAHVCVLQTAKDLVAAKQDVVVLNDAITSRSIYDYSTAIAEMRDCGVRLSSVETVLFELLSDSAAPEFRQISQLIK